MLGNKGSRKFYRSGGTRGGQDQFKWEDVKSDKYRENYLGHSVLAPVGRWQKGKDLNWYAKSKTEQEVMLDEEKERMRQQDEDLIDEALGLKKKRRVDMGNDLDALDIKALLSRGGTERASEDIQRIQGLGAAPAKIHDHIEKNESSSMYTSEIHRLQQLQQEKQGSSGGDDRGVSSGSSSSSMQRSSSSTSHSSSHDQQPGRHGEDRDQDRERERQERKAHKHEKHAHEKKEKSKKHEKDKDRDHHHHKEDKESKSKKHKKDKDRKRDRSPSV